MKRTTLILDPVLYQQLKRRAARDGRTLTEVVEQTLRTGLRAPARTARVRSSLPSYDLGPFLVDPSRRSAAERPATGTRPSPSSAREP
jgi:hypothetical protein